MTGYFEVVLLVMDVRTVEKSQCNRQGGMELSSMWDQCAVLFMMDDDVSARPYVHVYDTDANSTCKLHPT